MWLSALALCDCNQQVCVRDGKGVLVTMVAGVDVVAEVAGVDMVAVVGVLVSSASNAPLSCVSVNILAGCQGFPPGPCFF